MRRKILLYLYKIYPRSEYLSSLSKKLHIDLANAIGALRGFDKRYRKEYSLIEMGLVETVKINGVTYYRLSEKGYKILKEVEEYERDEYIVSSFSSFIKW